MGRAEDRASAEKTSQRAWRVYRARFLDVERIAKHGPGPGDEDLIRGVFCLVAAQLILQSCDAQDSANDN